MSDENKKDEPKVQADNNSIAVGNISASGNIGDVNITTGYTVEQVSVLITQIQSTFQTKPFDGRCPYKGLDVFEEEDAELFFGREKLVDNLVSRMKDSRTVFVTGPSGSGKSSLVRAGLIHALKQGAIKNSERWLYATMKPGRYPLESLATAFSRLKSPELGNYFRQHVDQVKVLHECAESALTDNKNQRLVLFIDQFEEVFTQISKEEERVAFLNLLTHAAAIENGRVIILFSMRSDFVSNCATYPQLNALLNQQFVQIGAMQPEELVSAIAQPALRVGLRIDPDLIAQIINEMKGEPGALPLMQFALKDLFDSQQEKSGVIALTLNDYLQRGGIHKALERHADDSFSKLSKNEQELARSIFSALIEIGRGTQDTKRTALFDELVPVNTKAEDVEAIVQKLADARLVTTDEQAGKDTVTISHEKLIDAWPWLKKLVNENRDVIALQNEIVADAKEWEEHKRDASYLYSGARLINAREKLETRNLILSNSSNEFVKAGRFKQRRSQIILVSGVSTVIIVLIAAVIVFGILTKEAQKQSQIALARQLAAQAQTIFRKNNSTQQTAVLLAIQSMKMYPSVDSAQYLQNNTLARPVARMSHDFYVISVVFSPDGKYVVSSGAFTARVGEAATGKEVARMTHDDVVWTAAFSPDGKYVVSGSQDTTARVWEANTGKEIARMTHDDGVRSVAFSPDGRYVVSGSVDGTARVWEAKTGKEIARMTHDEGVLSIAFSPDGRYVVSGGDNTARVWEAGSGNEITRMTHDDGVSSVAFSPDGRYVVSGGGTTARVWEASTGDEIARMTHDEGVLSIAFSPDGRYVVSGSVDGTARVWEANTGNEIARMIHDGWVQSVAFSPNNKYVASGSADGTARVWEFSTGKEVARMTHGVPDAYGVFSVAFSPDGNYVVSGSDDGNASVWGTASGQEIIRMTHDTNNVTIVAFSPDGKYMIVGEDNTIHVWNIATGKEVARMTHDYAVWTVAFSPDGKYVVSGSDDNTARVWEINTGKEVARMAHNDGVRSVAFGPDGKYAVSGSRDGTARVWEAKTGKEIVRMTHDDAVYSVAFSHDGRYVVSGGDNTARVWEANTGKEIARMTHDDAVYSVAFSHDGRYVVSGGGNTARVWEASSGNEITHITDDESVNSVSFSSDDKYIVSISSNDKTAHVWDVSTGKEIAHMTHDAELYSANFTSNGDYVISRSWDKIAHVWKYRPEDLITEACSRVTRNLTRDEWKKYIDAALPYQAVCPNLPIEPEATPTPTP